MDAIKSTMKELQLLLIFYLSAVATPGPQIKKVNDTDYLINHHCSLMEYASVAHCQHTNTFLSCNQGLTNDWTKGAKHEISHLRLSNWPGECINMGRLFQHFPELKVLELLNGSALTSMKSHFDGPNKIEKLIVHGATSLWEVPADVIAQMPELRELDLRSNVLRHMRARLLRDPPLLERVYLSDNKWDCSDGGLDWLAMESQNGSTRRKIVDYSKLVCHQKLYRGKPLPKVMDIIKTIKLTCPAPCSCVMTNVVSDSAGTVIPLITVDCAERGLENPPPKLPASATVLRLEGNKINSIRMIMNNPEYKKLADLYLDNNSISAVKELEGSEWFSAFRVLSLRGNMLKQIPVYAFDKAFQANTNVQQVFLGLNPWRCDCHFIPRFQGLLRKYKRVIRDLPDIRCSKSDDKTTSLAQISTIPLGNVCRSSNVEMLISKVNIVNIVLAFFIVLVIGRFLYDWHSFKTTGKLPWISSILP